MTHMRRPVRHNFPPELYPITVRIYSGATSELLWERVIELSEARGPARVAIPGYGDTPHAPVNVEITYANGETHTGGVS